MRSLTNEWALSPVRDGVPIGSPITDSTLTCFDKAVEAADEWNAREASAGTTLRWTIVSRPVGNWRYAVYAYVE